ncbi:MAG: DUF1833 family protein [Rhodovulum sp.]|nr:DUF1833 family protein [Rhodovulum sp.]
MSVTEAMREAWAANPAGETIIETIELDHVTFDQPVRIACNVSEDVDLPPAAGADPVTWTAIAVSVVPPGVDDGGPSPMRLGIDLLSQHLLPYLEAATAATSPISVTYRSYTTADLSRPGELITGLELRVASLTATEAQVTVAWPQTATRAFPRATYDSIFYPALQNE